MFVKRLKCERKATTPLLVICVTVHIWQDAPELLVFLLIATIAVATAVVVTFVVLEVVYAS